MLIGRRGALRPRPGRRRRMLLDRKTLRTLRRRRAELRSGLLPPLLRLLAWSRG